MVNDDGGVVHTQTCIPALNRFSEELVCVSKSVIPTYLHLSENYVKLKKNNQ